MNGSAEPCALLMKADVKFHVGLCPPLNGMARGIGFPGNIVSYLVLRTWLFSKWERSRT